MSPTRANLVPILPYCLSPLSLSVHPHFAHNLRQSSISNRNKSILDLEDSHVLILCWLVDDWLTRFRGNMDDSFRLGVTFTAKYMRLYSEFYKSDLIVASPLGLRLAIEEHSTYPSVLLTLCHILFPNTFLLSVYNSFIGIPLEHKV